MNNACATGIISVIRAFAHNETNLRIVETRKIFTLFFSPFAGATLLGANKPLIHETRNNERNNFAKVISIRSK